LRTCCAGLTRRARIALASSALAVLLVATFSPLAELGEERLFSAHMVQHLLLGDVAPLLLALALGARAALVQPLLALVAWCGALVLWHVPSLYDEALRSEAVHQLQHLTFFLAGLVLWGAILGERASVQWRIGAVVGVGLAGLVFGNVFIWARHVVYSPYATAPRAWGLSPLADQQLGGAIMLAEGAAVTIAVFTWLVLRTVSEGEGAAPAV
jgi:cytochrome c oxidase assembly factor CtaG